MLVVTCAGYKAGQIKGQRACTTQQTFHLLQVLFKCALLEFESKVKRCPDWGRQRISGGECSSRGRGPPGSDKRVSEFSFYKCHDVKSPLTDLLWHCRIIQSSGRQVEPFTTRVAKFWEFSEMETFHGNLRELMGIHSNKRYFQNWRFHRKLNYSWGKYILA